MIELPFAAQEGDAGYSQHSRETLINMYAEPASGKTQLVRRQRPGLRLVEPLVGNKRGIAEFVHGYYFVVRDALMRYREGAIETLGFLNTRTGYVTIVSDDNDNVALADGEFLYHYDGDTFEVILTPTEVGTLTFAGGRGFYSEPGTDRFYMSGMNDLKTWDALDFASAESQADRLVRIFEDRGELWAFGERTVDIFRNTGDLDFPFRYNTTLQRGCAAAFSVASDDNTVFWLGDDRIVYRADGYRPARISTHAIEDWLEQAPSVAQARAFTYTTRGHKFYTLTIPRYGTRQFNIATGLWNAAETWGAPEWRVWGGAGKPTGFLLDDHGLVEMDAGLNTDSGHKMLRGGVSAPVYNQGERMTFSEFWMNVEVGRVAEGNPEPSILLQVSRNGESFGTSRPRGMGLTGDYNRRIMWRGLGQARSFSLKYTVTDDVAVKVTSTGGVIQ